MSGAESKKLDEIGKRYLRRERKLLIAFVIIGWAFFGAGTIYFAFQIYPDLGSTAPTESIYEQSATEQSNQITNSKLGKTGGLPLKDIQINERGSHEKESENEKTALDYLLDARDLDAQEGVWKASRVIALVAFVQTAIGILGLFLIYRTLKETQVVGNEAKKTTRQAIRATNAAIRSADAAENAERAHIFAVIDADFVVYEYGPPSDKGEFAKVPNKEQIAVGLSVINHGKTPAKNITCTSNIFHGLGAQSPGRKNWVDILPAGKNTFVATLGSFKTETYLSESGRKLPIAWIRIDYEDVFGNPRSTEHTSAYVEFKIANTVLRLPDDRMSNPSMVNAAINAIKSIQLVVQHGR